MRDTMTTENTKRILVIDDDQFLIELYALAFQKAGYVVDAAWNGKEALALFDKGAQAYEAAVVDLFMPEIDGFGFIQVALDKKLLPANRIFVLTNYGEKEHITRAQELGVRAYVLKAHHTPDEIIELIRTKSGK